MWGARFFNRALGSNFPRFDVRNQIRGHMPSLPISTSTNFTHACRLDTLKFVDFVLGRRKVSRLSSFCRVFDALDANIRLWISQEIIKWSLPWDFRIWHHLKRKKESGKVQSQGFNAWPPILFHQLPTGAALLQRLDVANRAQRKRRWESGEFDRFDCVTGTPGEVLGGINNALKLRECWNVSQKTGKKWKELASEKFGNRILGSLSYVEICVNLGQQSIVGNSHDIGTSFCDAISTQISKHHKHQKLFVLEISESFELSAGLLFHQEIGTHDSVPSVRRSASRHHAMPTYAIDGGAEIAVTRHDPAQNNHSEIFKWWFVHVCMMDDSWWFHISNGDTVTQSALRNQPPSWWKFNQQTNKGSSYPPQIQYPSSPCHFQEYCPNTCWHLAINIISLYNMNHTFEFFDWGDRTRRRTMKLAEGLLCFQLFSWIVSERSIPIAVLWSWKLCVQLCNFSGASQRWYWESAVKSQLPMSPRATHVEHQQRRYRAERWDR